MTDKIYMTGNKATYSTAKTDDLLLQKFGAFDIDALTISPTLPVVELHQFSGNKAFQQLNARLDVVEKENKDLKAENKNLKRRFEELSVSPSSPVFDFTKMFNEMNRRLDNLDAENNNLKAENNNFKEKNNELNNRMTVLETDNNNLKAEVINLKAENNNFKAENNNFKAENNNFKEKNNELNNRMTVLETDNNNLKSEVKAMDAKMNRMGLLIGHQRTVSTKLYNKLDIVTETANKNVRKHNLLLKKLSELKENGISYDSYEQGPFEVDDLEPVEPFDNVQDFLNSITDNKIKMSDP